MGSVNKVILLGNIGRDPETRFLPSGDPVANFSLATTETWKDKNNQKREETTWHHVEVFGSLANIVKDYCKKGKQVYIEGALKVDEWEDKDGAKRVKVKVKLAGPGAKLVLLGGGGEKQRDTRGDEVSDSDVPFVVMLPFIAPLLLGIGAFLA